jgi:transposase
MGGDAGTGDGKTCRSDPRGEAAPEQGYRSCLGILRLSKKYGGDRVEIACGRAMSVGARSYRHVESILRHGLDRIASAEVAGTARPAHENIRGPGYYD